MMFLKVYKLEKLFRAAPFPTQENYTQHFSVPRDSNRKRPQKDRYAPGSSRTQSTLTHERRHKASPPPRREEPPHDLYISEREYRAYGLRRTEPTQHRPILPPDSSYCNVNRDHVPLVSYHPPVDHDRVLRLAEIERHHDRREAPLLNLPERDYRLYDHLSSRREILARNSPNPPPPAVTLDSYRRVDPYYSYEHRAPERSAARTYLGREEDDLYSRYVTADSLAEYYRSSSLRRYPSTAESEPLPSSLISRYTYSHR